MDNLLNNSMDSLLNNSMDSLLNNSMDSLLNNSMDSLLNNSIDSLLNNSTNSVLGNLTSSVLDNSTSNSAPVTQPTTLAIQITTPEPSPNIPETDKTSAYVVEMAVSIPIAIAEFDNQKKESFKTATARTAGVSTVDVSIVQVSSVAESSGRRLLAQSTRIDFVIQANTRTKALGLRNRLSDTSQLNSNMQQSGLPQVTVLTQPTARETELSNTTPDVNDFDATIATIWPRVVLGCFIAIFAFFTFVYVLVCKGTPPYTPFTPNTMPGELYTVEYQPHEYQPHEHQPHEHQLHEYQPYNYQTHANKAPPGSEYFE